MSSPTSLKMPKGRTAARVPTRLPESISVQQEVLIVALVRLSKALVSPNHINERMENICAELGVSLQGLASVVGDRLGQERTLLEARVGSDGVSEKQQVWIWICVYFSSLSALLWPAVVDQCRNR